MLPRLEQGDYAALLDTGAYYFSNPFGYNSLPRPGVHGFTVTGGEVRFVPVREPQTLAEIVTDSGGTHRNSLTDTGRETEPDRQHDDERQGTERKA
jgi:diaminopimelate decarboxylase